MHSRRALLRLGTTIIAGIGLVTACSPTRGTSTASSPSIVRGRYAALGDSYTSGPDIPQQVGTPAGCKRSDRSYPALVAHHLDLSTSRVRDASCSGATIRDLSTAQKTGSGTNPPQLDALSAATALVTLGIGGNDVGFTDVMTRCTALDAPVTLINMVHKLKQAKLAPCRASYTADGTDQMDRKIQTAGARLATALTKIRRRAPHARVYVVGYPDLLPKGGTSCAHGLGMTPGDVAYLNKEEKDLNTVIEARARSAGDTYVDTYTPSIGHDACSAAATRWIEPLVPTGAARLHPNARGQHGMAKAVEHAIAD